MTVTQHLYNFLCLLSCRSEQRSSGDWHKREEMKGRYKKKTGGSRRRERVEIEKNRKGENKWGVERKEGRGH